MRHTKKHLQDMIDKKITMERCIIEIHRKYKTMKPFLKVVVLSIATGETSVDDGYDFIEHEYNNRRALTRVENL